MVMLIKPSITTNVLLKASFYIAIQDDCVRKNPFDFQLKAVLDDDTVPKTVLTEEQEEKLLAFAKADKTYSKNYDEILILLKTGSYFRVWWFDTSRFRF